MSGFDRGVIGFRSLQQTSSSRDGILSTIGRIYIIGIDNCSNLILDLCGVCRYSFHARAAVDDVQRRGPSRLRGAGGRLSRFEREETAVAEDLKWDYAPKIPSLTGIRGIASFWVVLVHFGTSLSSVSGIKWLGSIAIVSRGYLGVDLFFILSGFVLTLNYAAPVRVGVKRDARTFLVGRVFRLFPLNCSVLILLVVLVRIDPTAYWGPGPLHGDIVRRCDDLDTRLVQHAERVELSRLVAQRRVVRLFALRHRLPPFAEAVVVANRFAASSPLPAPVFCRPDCDPIDERRSRGTSWVASLYL